MEHNSTDHPGEGWVATDEFWVRLYPHGADARLWFESTRGVWLSDFYAMGKRTVIAPAPTAALAAQRVAVLADEVRQDVARLAEAWGVCYEMAIDWAKAPAVTVDREAAIEVVSMALHDAEQYYRCAPHDRYYERPVPSRVLDAVLATIDPTPTAKEATNG